MYDGLMAAMKAPREAPACSQRVGYVNQQIDTLASTIGQLEDRLAMVLGPDDPMATGESNGQQDRSRLEGEIRHIGDSISQQSMRLRRLIDRLEV